MNPTHEEVLSAMFDGEATDPLRLAEALSAEGACETLRDWALLSAEVRDVSAMDPRIEAEGGEHGSAPDGSWWRRRISVPWPVAAASAALVAVMLLWAPAPRHPVEADQLTPPHPERLLRFEPGIDWNR